MTPELEKKIEETAKQLAGFSPLQEVDDEERYYQSHKCNTYDACIKMAKSDAAKDYWQKGMYTQGEVKEMKEIIFRFHILCNAYSYPSESFKSKVKDWISKHME